MSDSKVIPGECRHGVFVERNRAHGGVDRSCVMCISEERSAQFDAMAALLRELEWADTGERGFSDSDKPDTRCPVCHECGYDGHSSDCRLDALLRSLP